MGKIAEEIERIKEEENLTLDEVFNKYPHLLRLLVKEAGVEESKKDHKGRQLLLD